MQQQLTLPYILNRFKCILGIPTPFTIHQRKPQKKICCPVDEDYDSPGKIYAQHNYFIIYVPDNVSIKIGSWTDSL